MEHLAPAWDCIRAHYPELTATALQAIGGATVAYRALRAAFTHPGDGLQALLRILRVLALDSSR